MPPIPLTDEQIKKINEEHQKGVAPMINAIHNRCTVEQVLEAIGQAEMLQITMPGDQVDVDEVDDPSQINARGRTYKLKYPIG